ncbi:hypothetical protein Tco_1360190 [Tanacetum coccineum]
MPPRMTTRSAGRSTATPRGGGTGGRVGRGARRTREPVRRNNETISKLDVARFSSLNSYPVEQEIERNYGLALQIHEMVASMEPSTIKKLWQKKSVTLKK